ncbi:MAG TPA: 4a-hydroxytetrahydrobiopterin dehydratase [Actinomycetes bacterium]|nr:4a-hydroxytetrahydrobiopterin dehydratase [Actinomycetes bacterium]
MSRLLDDAELVRLLSELPGWERAGESIHRSLKAPDFPTAIRIVDEIAVDAEEMNHHPDIDIRWRNLDLTLSTHSAGGLTQLDIELAHRISAIAATHDAH